MDVDFVECGMWMDFCEEGGTDWEPNPPDTDTGTLFLPVLLHVSLCPPLSPKNFLIITAVTMEMVAYASKKAKGIGTHSINRKHPALT